MNRYNERYQLNPQEFAQSDKLYIQLPPDIMRDPRLVAQLRVFMAAFFRYQEANEEYQDNWTRMGWRGMLVRVRERAERLWDSLWNHPAPQTALASSEIESKDKKLDDAIDLINFAAFLVRAVDDNNRDGSWWDRRHGR